MNIPSLVLKHIDELDRLRTRDDAWQIPRIEGEMLHHIALASRAKLIVEIGTSYGFSGLFWGSALLKTDGHLHTVDNNPKKYDSAKLTFAQAGVNTVITNHLGDARQIIPRLPSPVDIAFIDADKPSCQAYFQLLWPKIRVGGSIITDNAITHRAELAPYVAFLRSLPDASSTEVGVGNGIEWTIKVR